LRFHFIVHTSLDMIDERLKRKGKTDRLDKFLGLLCPVEEYKVYGFVTNTDVKLMIVVQEDHVLKDQELRQFFAKFQDLYIQAACNPFYESNTEIKSPKFDQAILNLVIRGF